MHSLFQIGDLVFATEDIYNDGGFPNRAIDALLVPKASRGVIVNEGYAELDPSQRIYLVRFETTLGDTLGDPIGCLAEDITHPTDTDNTNG